MGSLIQGWTETNAPSNQLGYSASCVCNGYLYRFGGRDLVGTAYVDVEFSYIKLDHSLDEWQITTSLPLYEKSGYYYGRFSGRVCSADGYIYYTGGSYSTNGYSAISDILVAKPNSDGTISGWAVLTNGLGLTLYCHAMIIKDNYMYIFGGTRGQRLSLNYNRYATIVGYSIGSWNCGDPLVEARYGHGFVEHDGYIYLQSGFLNRNTGERIQILPNKSTGTPEYDTNNIGSGEKFSIVTDDNNMISAGWAGGGSSSGFDDDNYSDEWTAEDVQFSEFINTITFYDGYAYIIDAYTNAGTYTPKCYYSYLTDTTVIDVPDTEPEESIIYFKYENEEAIKESQKIKREDSKPKHKGKIVGVSGGMDFNNPLKYLQ